MLWIGDVNAGLRIKWKSDNYLKPLINLYYAYAVPLRRPPSWGNGGAGGVQYCGLRGSHSRSCIFRAPAACAGRNLHFDFELLVSRHFEQLTRRCDGMIDTFTAPDELTAEDCNGGQRGANIINIHHAEDVYPFHQLSVS